MDTLLALIIGIGLSAACGFRVFVPLLITSIAAHAGYLQLAKSFQWIGSDVALITFSIATILEIAGYYIPWFDHFLDTMATPAAVIAGTLLTAAMISGMSPFLKWTLAVIAGGGTAGLVQGATVLTRGASTATTGGLANPIFATIELGGSIFMSVVTLWIPVVGICLAITVFVFLSRKVYLRLSRKKLSP
ncbi:MAG: putative rane protein [Verrucomicrobiales bacterium]|nr:putative rane protein [Verrucomicrobiales bacterium]